MRKNRSEAEVKYTSNNWYSLGGKDLLKNYEIAAFPGEDWLFITLERVAAKKCVNIFKVQNRSLVLTYDI